MLLLQPDSLRLLIHFCVFPVVTLPRSIVLGIIARAAFTDLTSSTKCLAGTR